MAWQVERKKGEDGQTEYHCFLHGRRKAVIYKKPKAAQPWLVCRITHAASREVESGVDSFKSFADARDFVTNRPSIWGS